VTDRGKTAGYKGNRKKITWCLAPITFDKVMELEPVTLPSGDEFEVIEIR
jgi:hypothetical protein